MQPRLVLVLITVGACGKDAPTPHGLDAGSSIGRPLPPPLDVFPMRPDETSTVTETRAGTETTTRHREVCDVLLPDLACTATDLAGAEREALTKFRVTKSGLESLGTMLSDLAIVHDPPQVILPVDYRVGTTWQQTIATAMIWRPTGEVEQFVTEWAARIEATDACAGGLRVVRIGDRNDGTHDEIRDTYCPGRGVVETNFTRLKSGVETARSRSVVDP